MDVAALILAILAIVVFVWPGPPFPINWGFALLTAALICQFTTITDSLTNL